MLSLFKKLFTGKPASTGTESLPSVNQEKKTKPGSVTPELQASPNCPQPLPVQSDISKNNRAEGNYLLMEGIRIGSVEKVRQALEVGADVNYEIEELPKPGSFRGLEIGSFLEGIPMKRNALDIAVNNGYMEVAKFLMQNGAILPSNYSDDENRLGDYAWYFYNSIQSTSPLGKKKPNAWGLYDMTGNVWEWTDDWYDYSCSHRVIRGGSWSYDVGSCRSAYRCGRSPGRRSYEIGFRLVFVP